MAVFANREYDAVLSSYCQFGFITKRETDVTLIMKGNRYLSAHKMVLSSVGNFLKRLCTESETIILPEVEYETMASFLSLLYTGQAFMNGSRDVRQFATLMDMLDVSLPNCVTEQLRSRYGEDYQPPVSDINVQVQDIFVDQTTRRGAVVSGPSESRSSHAGILSAKSAQGRKNLENESSSMEVYPSPSSPVLRVESPVFLNIGDTREDQADDSIGNIDDPLRVDIDHLEEPELITHLQTGDDSGERLVRSQPPTGDRTFRCDFCARRFRSISELTSHLRSHVAKHKCGKCKQEFKLKASLTRHLRAHGGKRCNVRQYRCFHCEKRFHLKSHLSQHLHLHTSDRPYQCSHCDKRFYQESRLNEHLRLHTSDSSFQCPQCEKKFYHKNQLNYHMQSHVDRHPNQCSLCQKIFRDKTDLRRHMDVHTRGRQYRAKKKLNRGSRRKDLRYRDTNNRLEITDSHPQPRTAKPPFSCGHCFKNFKSNSLLKRHLRIHNGERPVQCAHCPKKFMHKGSLKRHSRIHGIGQLYQCSHCDVTFKNGRSLDIHLRYNCQEIGGVKVTPDSQPEPSQATGSKFICEYCFKGFGNKYTLATHLRTHTGERPFRCSRCERRFTQKSALNRHFKRHVRERLYLCVRCGIDFRNGPNLENHLRYNCGDHANKQNDSAPQLQISKGGVHCRYCFKIVANRGNLTNHMRLHTGERPFNCTRCPKKYPSKESLQKHLKDIHVE